MEASEDKPLPRTSINWASVLFQVYIHMSALYGLWLVFIDASWKTTLFCIILVFLGTIGITLGCHRLWAHRTYKAVWPLRTFLAACHLLTCQGSAYDWVVDHRVHHKYFGTHNDPYNYKRGFYYCHIAAHCMDANPDIERLKRHTVTTDLEEDSVCYYQKWLYYLLMPVFGIILPINAGMEYFGDSAITSIFVLGFLRIIILQHILWLINSASLIWGLDPADKKSGDTWLVFFITKSLWPQYHYLLPWDYRSGEFGTYGSGCSTAILRVFAALGWAYDLTTISSNGVKEALYKAAESKRPLKECLDEEKFTLPDIFQEDPHHY